MLHNHNHCVYIYIYDVRVCRDLPELPAPHAVTQQPAGTEMEKTQNSVYIYNVHVLMRDEKEGRKKQARSNKHVC